MDQRGITPVDVDGGNAQESEANVPVDNRSPDCQSKDNVPVDEQSPDPQPNDNVQQNTTQSPEPESGIGKDVDSCDEMDPDGDLGKGDDLEFDKPKKIEDTEQDASDISDDEKVQGDSNPDQAKPKTTSKPPRFNNTVDPMEYDIPIPKPRKRAAAGWFGGRGPRKAVVIIVGLAVLAVALVVGLVLLADIPPPPESARLYGYFETNNRPYIAAKYNTSEDIYNVQDEFEYAMENMFYNTSFENAYNHTKVEHIIVINNFLAFNFILSMTYYFTNETTEGINMTTSPPVTTMEATTMDNAMMNKMAIDDENPLWAQIIRNFVYQETAAGKLTNFTGTMTLSFTDPDSITTSTGFSSTMQPTTRLPN